MSIVFAIGFLGLYGVALVILAAFLELCSRIFGDKLKIVIDNILLFVVVILCLIVISSSIYTIAQLVIG